MRRTHASLMKERGIDDKTISDQLGHTVDVDLNTYQRTSVEHRLKALEQPDNAIENSAN